MIVPRLPVEYSTRVWWPPDKRIVGTPELRPTRQRFSSVVLRAIARACNAGRIARYAACTDEVDCDRKRSQRFLRKLLQRKVKRILFTCSPLGRLAHMSPRSTAH